MSAHKMSYISAMDMYLFISNVIVATTHMVYRCWQKSAQNLAITGSF